MPALGKSDTRIGQWLRGLLARAHANTAVVALAAKMARDRLGAAAARTRLRAGGGNRLNRAWSAKRSSAFRCLRAVRGR